MINPSTFPIIIIHDSEQAKWLQFTNPSDIIVGRKIQEIRSLLQLIEQKVSTENLYAVGFLSYEAAPAFDRAFKTHISVDNFPLLWFGLFDRYERIEPKFTTAGTYQLSNWQPSISRKEYNQAIEEIKTAIACGDTYQVNYTIRLYADFKGDPWSYFLKLIAAQNAKYSAYLNIGDFVISCASPELFFEYNNGHVVCRPMKGTAKRGLSYEDDQIEADKLYNSVKNRAENVMIVDMIRNDLGRIAKIGTVKTSRLFDIERYPTVWQMTSTVEAKTYATISEIMAALFPCASITGAPKVSTMSLISRLENRPRRIYTGSIGLITPNNRAQFNVAIRTVLIDCRCGVAEYGVGGGIVWDSTPEGEYEECQTKAQLLTHTIPVFDLLETLRWTKDEGYFLLYEHLDRLRKSASYFGYPYNRVAIEKALNEQAQSFSSPQKVRLILRADGTFEIHSNPLPPSTEPVRLVLAKNPINSHNVYLYHKTTYRNLYEQARIEADIQDNDSEVLLWNERGEITESEIANIVVKIAGKLITPPVSCGLLPGVFRKWLLEKKEIQEDIIYLEDLPKCEEIFLVNSVRKWRQGKIDLGYKLSLERQSYDQSIRKRNTRTT